MNNFPILLVSYGGSHQKIIAEIAVFLRKKKLPFKILSLPASYLFFKDLFPQNVITFKDLFPLPSQSSCQFEKFWEILYQNSLGNPLLEEETFYYLFYSLKDTISLLEDCSYYSYFSYWRFPIGFKKWKMEEKLNYLWKKYRRQFLLPLFSLKEILKKLKPRLVITTNSPRAERAALLASLELKITNMAVIDGLGNTEQYPLQADYIVTPSLKAKERILKKGGKGKFLLWGNPLWERLKKVDTKEAFQFLMNRGIDYSDKKIFLFAFSPVLIHPEESKKMWELAQRLSWKDNNLILIKFHPNDDREKNISFLNKENFFKSRSNFLFLESKSDIYSYLKLADLTFVSHSTVGIEAAVLKKKVVVYDCSNSLLKGLDELKNVFFIDSLEELQQRLPSLLSFKIEDEILVSNFREKFSVFLEEMFSV